MKSCLLCPRGKDCRGHVLHLLILKLYAAMEEGANASALARELSAEDMRLLADYGESARTTCWSKGFVLAVAVKLAQLAQKHKESGDLKAPVENMIVRMDSLFSKLPNGIRIDIEELSLEVYNQASVLLREKKATCFLPANVLGAACATVYRRKEEALAEARAGAASGDA
ncbi:MAG: hypothetical protein HQL38_16615 [Alphaproteobacteria bacterium]|nr:hypothetical protein [Alphaproteobacteria bacterium]